MRKHLTKAIIFAGVLTVATTAAAQEPGSATRQRKATSDSSVTAGDVAKPNSDQSGNPKASDGPFTDTPRPEGSKPKALAEVSADATTNRTDPNSEESAIVPYYNNFFITYRLGPEDIISVNVFGQDRYSKQGIKIPPSGRISLALIPDGVFVNGKTVDQVAELIRKRYDEYIIDPQVSVSLDQAGSYRYSVVGDVGQPGIKLMNRRLSVSEAVAEAGGVLDTGNKKKIVVLRKNQNGMLTQIPVNLSAVYRGEAQIPFIWFLEIR